MTSNNTQADQLVWLITGCSSGFGTEFVRQLLSRGDLVIATARTPSKLQHLQQLPHSDNQLSLLQLDVTASQESLKGTIAEAIKIHGRIDVLINNAGYLELGTWEDLGYEGFVKQFETNVFGPVKVTNAVLPHMRERKSGTLVFVSSLCGWKGDGFCGAYGGSKFAVEGIVEALQDEVAPLGIRTLLVEPGMYRTNVLSPGNMLGSVSQIDDYRKRSETFLGALAGADLKQRGDPVKAVKIILDVVRNEGVAAPDQQKAEMKLRLPLGPDAYATLKNKCDETLKLLGEWEDVIKSTDVDE